MGTNVGLVTEQMRILVEVWYHVSFLELVFLFYFCFFLDIALVVLSEHFLYYTFLLSILFIYTFFFIRNLQN
jgi:hypothetical protein